MCSKIKCFETYTLCLFRQNTDQVWFGVASLSFYRSLVVSLYNATSNHLCPLDTFSIYFIIYLRLTLFKKKIRNLMFKSCRLLIWFILVSRFSFFILIRPFVFPFEWFYTGDFWSPLYLGVRCEPSSVLKTVLLPWMERCLSGTHTTSSYIYPRCTNIVKTVLCPLAF